MTDSPVLVFDGECAFCARSVRRILDHDRRGTLRFAARSSRYGVALLARHPRLVDVDSLLWVEPLREGIEEVDTCFDAVLQVSRYLGGRWRAAEIARLLPGPARDACYRLIARHRHRLARHGTLCVIPSPDEAHRFLE